MVITVNNRHRVSAFVHFCRWDMVPPDRAASSQWEVHLSAVRDIDEGEEVLLSYGEASVTSSTQSKSRSADALHVAGSAGSCKQAAHA